MGLRSRSIGLTIILCVSDAFADQASRQIGFEGTEFTVSESETQEKSSSEILREIQDKYVVFESELSKRHRAEMNTLYKNFENPTTDGWHDKKDALIRRHNVEKFALEQRRNSELCSRIQIHCPKKSLDREITSIKNKDALQRK